MVLLPNGCSNYRLIILKESFCKLIAAIINVQLKYNINFHDKLKQIGAVMSTGTATIKAQLYHKMKIIQEVILFQV